MRNLAVAMLIMGSLFAAIAVVFMVRGAPSASNVAILIPSVFLLTAGGILFRQYRV